MLVNFIPALLAILLPAVIAGPMGQLDLATTNVINTTSSGVRFIPDQSDKAWINDCHGGSTYVSDTDDDSPLVGDCLTIVKNIHSGGSWEIEMVTCKPHQLVQYGTCAFSVVSCETGMFFHVGNSDIIDLIHDSISFAASKGRVEATGTTQCESGNEWTPVDWAIYRNK